MGKKNLISKAIAIILLIAVMAAAQTNVWDGTSDVIWYNANASKDTLFVANGQELAGMNQLVNNAITTFANKTIILTNDINLGNKSWTPIGDNSITAKRFAGVFDGNGHSISNLSVSGKTYAGLFGYVGANGQIKNLVVKVTNISGTTYAGGLTGYYASTKAIENCGVNISGNVFSTSNSGGLVGYGSGAITISNSYSTGNVSASSSNSYSTSNSGGLVGYGSAAITINNSYSTGNSTSSSSNSSSNSYSGGLVGEGSAAITINNSYSTGNSTSSSNSSSSNSNSGGLVGYGNGTITINNSYSTGNSSSNSNSSSSYSSYSGGLVGYGNATSTLTNCYASGTITATGTGTKYIGGIFGRYSSGTNTSVYYNSTGVSSAAGTGSPTGILGLNPTQLKKSLSFLNWDFEDVWAIDEDVSYPYLLEWKEYNNIEISGIKNLSYEYTANSIKPELKVRLKSNKTVLNKDSDYTLSYGSNKTVSEGGTVVIAGMGDYDGVISEIIKFNIIPKELNITGAVANNKVYDGTVSAQLTITGIYGIIGDDNVSVKDKIGVFADKNVAQSKAVSAQMTLQGADAGNYKLIQPEGLTAEITRKLLVITLEPKVYNIAISDEVPNFIDNLTYISFAAGDTKDVITGTTNINCPYVKGTSPMGVYAISLSGPLGAANYQISYDNSGLVLIVGDDPKPAGNFIISPIPDQIYTGREIEPSVIVKDGEIFDEEITLIAGTHYSLSYSNNVEISNSAIVAVTGIPSGGYSGVKYASFKIIPDDTPIHNKPTDKKHGILLDGGVVSQEAKITVRTPERAQINLAIYDNLGNVIFEKSGIRNDKEILWNLTNAAGRNVANGSYLIIAEAKGVNGKVYRYSAKVGVKR